MQEAACARAHVRACVRACMRVCVRVCVKGRGHLHLCVCKGKSVCGNQIVCVCVGGVV